MIGTFKDNCDLSRSFEYELTRYQNEQEQEEEEDELDDD